MIDLNDRRLASLIVDMVDRRVEQKLRAIYGATRYGSVVGAPDTAKRQVAVKLLGQDDPSPGFVYGEVVPVDGDFVRVIVDPRGDRYVDAVLGRDAVDYAPASGVPGNFSIGGILSVGAIAGLVPVVTAYAPGTTSWNVPAGLLFAVVEVVGGGGGSGGCATTAAGEGASSGAGGGGGYARKLFTAADLSGASSFSVVVGAKGTKGATGATGSTGGTSTFSGTGITSVVGNGGNGGSGSAGTTGNASAGGGTGGTATGGDVNIPGGDGGRGEVATGTRIYTAVGGGTPLGPPQPPMQGVGVAATGFGTGAGGSTLSASSTAVTGGDGAPGAIIITSFFGP